MIINPEKTRQFLCNTISYDLQHAQKDPEINPLYFPVSPESVDLFSD